MDGKWEGNELSSSSELFCSEGAVIPSLAIGNRKRNDSLPSPLCPGDRGASTSKNSHDGDLSSAWSRMSDDHPTSPLLLCDDLDSVSDGSPDGSETYPYLVLNADSLEAPAELGKSGSRSDVA
jgi:hypothetical protein